MTYKAVFTDEFLSHFCLDDNDKTLVLIDKTGLTRAVMLEEVKHGHWELDGTCSVCKRHALQSYGNFCCYCGADMRSVTGDDNDGQ